MVDKLLMLERFNLLSINQTSAQIKLLQAWKASRDLNYPINLTKTRLAEEEQNDLEMLDDQCRGK